MTRRGKRGMGLGGVGAAGRSLRSATKASSNTGSTGLGVTPSAAPARARSAGSAAFAKSTRTSRPLINASTTPGSLAHRAEAPARRCAGSVAKAKVRPRTRAPKLLAAGPDRAVGPRSGGTRPRSAPPRRGRRCSRARVMPSPTRVSTICQSSRRETGSTPTLGSSRRSSLGRPDQRAGQPELLLHAAREPPGEAPGERAETGESRAGARNAAPRRGARRPADRRRASRFSGHRQILVEAEALRHVADVGLDRLGVGDAVQAEDAHLPFIGRQKSGHQAHERGLAGTVRPDQTRDLTALNVRRQPVESSRGASTGDEALDHLEQLDDGVAHGAARLSARARGTSFCSSVSSLTVTGMP